MIAATAVLTCSACDNYRLIEGSDGLLIRCPDCLQATASRCPVHGRSVRPGGKCPECSYEAVAAQESIEHGVGVAGDPIAEALYGY